MMNRLPALLLLLAACGNPSHAPTENTAPPDTAAAATAASIDCGTVDSGLDENPPDAPDRFRCFVDAFAANQAATVAWWTTSDEGHRALTRYRVIPGTGGAPAEVEVVHDDRDDQWTADPGIHTQRCRSIGIEPTTSNGVALSPELCS